MNPTKIMLIMCLLSLLIYIAAIIAGSPTGAAIAYISMWFDYMTAMTMPEGVIRCL